MDYLKDCGDIDITWIGLKEFTSHRIYYTKCLAADVLLLLLLVVVVVVSNIPLTKVAVSHQNICCNKILWLANSIKCTLEMSPNQTTLLQMISISLNN